MVFKLCGIFKWTIDNLNFVLFWNNYRFTESCRRMQKEVPLTVCQTSPNADLLYDNSTTSKPGNGHWKLRVYSWFTTWTCTHFHVCVVWISVQFYDVYFYVTTMTIKMAELYHHHGLPCVSPYSHTYPFSPSFTPACHSSSPISDISGKKKCLLSLSRFFWLV